MQVIFYGFFPRLSKILEKLDRSAHLYLYDGLKFLSVRPLVLLHLLFRFRWLVEQIIFVFAKSRIDQPIQNSFFIVISETIFQRSNLFFIGHARRKVVRSEWLLASAKI